EEAIKAALAKGQDLDEVVTDVESASHNDELLKLIMNGTAEDANDAQTRNGSDSSASRQTLTAALSGTPQSATGLSIYPTPIAFLQAGLAMVYRGRPEQRPAADGSGGVNWQFHSRE